LYFINRFRFSSEKTMLDLSFRALRASGAIPYWFDLGFVQLKLNPKQRMYFWHPDFHPNIHEEDVHNHRYSFSSKIIVGEIIHETWTYSSDEKGDTECVEICNKQELKKISTGFMTMSGQYTLQAGSKYYFPSSGFHRTITKKAVVLLCKGEIETENTMILRPIGSSTHLCSCKKSENECWKIIEELLSV